MQNDLTASTKSMKNTCAYCQKELYGRSDQRFCNDNCRNTFNRQNRAQEKITEHENMPEILRIIKRNYELLKSSDRKALEENESIHMPVSDFKQLGIDSRFYTSTLIDSDGNTWYCIFERAYYIGDTYAYIKDFPQQAEV